jgi:NADH dehydrogenase
MPILSGQPVTLVGESRRRHSFIAEQDVAAFARAAVRNDGDSDTVLLGGPEGVTFRDAVRAYEEAIGRAIEVRSVAPGEPLPGLPAHVSALAASFESFDNIVPMDELAARYEVALTSIRRFAAWRAPVLAASR